MFQELKQEVLLYSKQSYEEQLFAGTSGNLSLYDRENNLMVITPSSILYPTMKIDDIIVMKTDGTIIEGHNQPSSEWRMHATVYQEKPEICGIVHTHSPYATSFAVTHKAIPVILIEMLFFLGGQVPVSDFAMPGTANLGKNAVQVLKGGKTACLLANHGVLAIGKDLECAHKSAIYTEDVAKIYTIALTNDEPTIIPENYQKQLLDAISLKSKI